MQIEQTVFIFLNFQQMISHNMQMVIIRNTVSQPPLRVVTMEMYLWAVAAIGNKVKGVECHWFGRLSQRKGIIKGSFLQVLQRLSGFYQTFKRTEYVCLKTEDAGFLC